MEIKTIKRYSNRKLYDTQTSKYVNLKEISAIVASGQEVVVVDKETNADITQKVILNAIVENESDNTLQTNTLFDIVKAGGLTKYIENIKKV